MKGLPERCLAVDLGENDICDVMANGLRSPMAIAALRWRPSLQGAEPRLPNGTAEECWSR
jgi:hypothetical protein